MVARWSNKATDCLATDFTDCTDGKGGGRGAGPLPRPNQPGQGGRLETSDRAIGEADWSLRYGRLETCATARQTGSLRYGRLETCATAMQTGSLRYGRLETCATAMQTGSLRYGRLETCATVMQTGSLRYGRLETCATGAAYQRFVLLTLLSASGQLLSKCPR
jgi:hypothetical protein